MASGPNWDLAAAADFADGRRGLVLVEAKAHAGELRGEQGGKRFGPDSNLANHERIGEAIAEARKALGGETAGVRIDRDRCYQFSNRLAFAWKLAAEGVPTVLVYLGLTGDDVIGQLSEPIRDDAHWRALVIEHTAEVLGPAMWERDLGAGRDIAPLWLLARSMPVARQSRAGRRRPSPHDEAPAGRATVAGGRMTGLQVAASSAFVTGSSRGIGRGIAIKLAECGVTRIGVHYLKRKEDAEQTARLVEERGARATLIQADVTKPPDIDRMFAEAREALGAIGIDRVPPRGVGAAFFGQC